MSKLIAREYKGNVFHFRNDGYFNMTKAAKAFGKEAKHFWSLTSTQEYLEALQETVGKADIFEATTGRNGGTWGHPKLAVFFARWVDVKFAVFWDMVIDDILNKKAELTITNPAESMTMEVPQTFVEALSVALELAKQNERMAAENRVMHDELNLVTVDEYRALTHRSIRQQKGSRSCLLRLSSGGPLSQTLQLLPDSHP